MTPDRTGARDAAWRRAHARATDPEFAARRRRAARLDWLKLIGIVGAVVTLLAVGIYFGVKYHNQHVHACKAAGGHVSHHTTYYTDHHGHTDSDTTYYCFTDHGQIDQW